MDYSLKTGSKKYPRSTGTLYHSGVGYSGSTPPGRPSAFSENAAGVDAFDNDDYRAGVMAGVDPKPRYCYCGRATNQSPLAPHFGTRKLGQMSHLRPHLHPVIVMNISINPGGNE